MRRIKFYLLLVVLFFVVSSGYGQVINTRLSTYFYGWERIDSLGPNAPSTTHVTGYQNILMDASYKKWSFNTSAQVEEDVTGKNDRGFGYRFYNLYVKGSNLFNALDLKLGRQYVSAGVGRNTLDGMSFKLKLGENKEYQFTGFSGVLTPLAYDFDYGNIKVAENFSFGGMFTFYGVKNLMLGLSYYNKKQKPLDYFATRIDSAFVSSRQVYIETGPEADQLVGLDASYSEKNYAFFGKGYYDLNQNKLFKGEISGSWFAMPSLKFSLGYNYKEPQISYNTIFWVFEHKQYQEIEGGVDFILHKKYNFYVNVSNVMFQDDNSLKFSLGMSHPAYGLSFIKYTGYSGESDGVYGYFNYQLLKPDLTLTSSLSYSNYKINNYSDNKSDALSGLLGLVWRPSPYVSVDAQGQFIKSRLYKNDTRFMIGFNYWLFS